MAADIDLVNELVDKWIDSDRDLWELLYDLLVDRQHKEHGVLMPMLYEQAAHDVMEASRARQERQWRETEADVRNSGAPV